MSENWFIRIEAWPYHGIRQVQAGDREQTFTVKAESIDAALKLAHVFQDGMLTNPAIWQAPIKEIRQAGHGEHARPTRPCPTTLREPSPRPPEPTNTSLETA